MPPIDALPAPFPERWPAAYRQRARSMRQDNPLLRSGASHPAECLPDPEGRVDPTGEQALSPLPFLVRKHRDRVLVLAASRCFLHCRFCFRRGQPERFRTAPDGRAWRDILQWLEAHPEVGEVILSGGDPLTLPDRRLAEIAGDLASVRHLQSWRIHTRAPVVAPERVTQRLVQALAGRLPLRVVCHANHPAELEPAFHRGARRLQEAGVALANQGVLLRGVNDDPEVLLALYQELGAAGVLPHYLHHPDRAPGTGRFQVSLRRGLGIHRELKQVATAHGVGAHVPRYVVDLPSGAGKCPVAALRAVGSERRGDRVRVRYRWVRPAGWEAEVADGQCEWWDVWEPVVNGAGIQGASTATPAATARGGFTSAAG